jgi:hypothetical protein
MSEVDISSDPRRSRNWPEVDHASVGFSAGTADHVRPLMGLRHVTELAQPLLALDIDNLDRTGDGVVIEELALAPKQPLQRRRRGC